MFFNNKPKRRLTKLTVEGDGDYSFDIVGESKYQSQLQEICGPRSFDGHEFETSAVLQHEPTNNFDKNAWAVLVDGLHVGYLSRPDAKALHLIFKRAGFAPCPIHVNAMISGGWERPGSEGFFGVKLDFSLDSLSSGMP